MLKKQKKGHHYSLSLFTSCCVCLRSETPLLLSINESVTGQSIASLMACKRYISAASRRGGASKCCRDGCSRRHVAWGQGNNESLSFHRCQGNRRDMGVCPRRSPSSFPPPLPSPRFLRSTPPPASELAGVQPLVSGGPTGRERKSTLLCLANALVKKGHGG